MEPKVYKISIKFTLCEVIHDPTRTTAYSCYWLFTGCLFSKVAHIALTWLCFFVVHCVMFIQSLPFFSVTCISNSVLIIFCVFILCISSTVTMTGITTGTSCFRIYAFSQPMVTVSHKQCFCKVTWLGSNLFSILYICMWPESDLIHSGT